MQIAGYLQAGGTHFIINTVSVNLIVLKHFEYFMKRSIIILVFVLISSVNFIAQEIKMDPVKKIIEEVKAKYAPDKRVAIFNVAAVQKGNSIALTGETNIEIAKQDLLDKLRNITLLVSDEIHLLPDSKLKGRIYGVVNLSVANIRTDHEHEAELATQALLGTPVKVYKYSSGFYLVQTPDNYIAWIDEDGLVLKDREQYKEWSSSEKIIYTKEFGFSYSEPSQKSLRVSDLAAGNILIYIGEEDNFYKVRYPDGRIAFTLKDDCSRFNSWLSRENPSETDIINTAKLFMGVPYLWGGTSVKGMDCSGFTKTVYFLNGIVLGRDASQQVHTGVLVDTQNGFGKLQPGDLLFFGKQKTDTTSEKITHVGIYIGNFQYIHAAGRVKINSFDKDAANFNAYRLDHFIRAKRILNSVDTRGITSVKRNKYYTGDI